MDARAIVRTKRDGGVLSADQIDAFMEGYVGGEIPEYMASALLMAIFARGMQPEELEAWTRAMLSSGTVFDLGHLDRPRADKHSTGGVGDKVSIPLAPAVASCGVAVPMISGRGLGHTGGTLDKLEAIPGFRTDLSAEEYTRALEEIGVALAGQTEDVVPADRKLYALRDATGLVESIPLVASSILSKKLAEGIEVLVLDVKFGSGAFFPDVERGRELARTMITLADRMGLKASAILTAMDRPLGIACGNALEIAESVDCLRGAGPLDLRELVCTLGGTMLRDAGVAGDAPEGAHRIAASLDDGSALEAFMGVVENQGGDPATIEDPSRLPQAPDLETVSAAEGGCLSYADVRSVGLAVVALGGGRRVLGDVIDPGVGVRCLRQAGDEVQVGDALFEVHHTGGHGLDEARAHLAGAISIGAEAELPPLVLEHVEG